ncbi:hypothetical protein BC829DRAFT_158632 [Chytridium lagenaria]|nr:hypothetical protein BC829DRAFT_158632 [Chytridium lagenaria]
MEAAMHITEVRLGEEEWQEALLRAVRVQSPLSILEKLVDAAVRESIWAERCGQLKSFGGREAAFAIVEALTNLRETDSDIGPEPMNQSSENQGSTFTKAFRGFHLIRGLIDEHDNSGDPITDDEMATLFSTLRFDRFRLDELETVHNDSRIPRELVASALMSGLRKREHEMRRTFKTCFQAICAFGLGKNSTRRISGSAFSTVRSNKSDIASQVTKDDITGLDSEDCGTLRVIQLPSAKKVSLGIHEAKGQADGGVIVKALQEDDALATVRGDRQGRLKSAVRVRPALRDDMFGGSGGSSSTSSSLVSPPSLSDESTDRSIQEVSNDIIESVLSQTPSAVVEESLQGGESNFGRKLRSTVVSRNGTFNQRMLESIREERDEQIPKTPASTITVDRRTKRVALSGLSWTERAQKDMGPPAPTFTKLPRQVSVPELIELAVAKLKDIAEDQKEEWLLLKLNRRMSLRLLTKNRGSQMLLRLLMRNLSRQILFRFLKDS